jgi:hypothetical protein
MARVHGLLNYIGTEVKLWCGDGVKGGRGGQPHGDAGVLAGGLSTQIDFSRQFFY